MQNLLRKEIAAAIVNTRKQQKRKTGTRLGGLLAKIRKKKRTDKEWIEKGMLHINFGHVGSISTSWEEFGAWGRALMVSSKVEDLHT